MLSVKDVIENTVDYVVKNSVYKGLAIKPKAKEFANIPQYKGNKLLYPSIDIRNSSVDTSLWFCSDAIEIFSDNKLLFEEKLKVFFRKAKSENSENKCKLYSCKI